MDMFTLVASIVLLGFIAWALARILGARGRASGDGTGADAGNQASWSVAPGGRRDADHGGVSDGGDSD